MSKSSPQKPNRNLSSPTPTPPKFPSNARPVEIPLSIGGPDAPVPRTVPPGAVPNNAQQQ